MADGNTMLRVKKIIESDPERRYVVVSAPGKRFGGDTKITDLLYDTFESVKLTGKPGAAFGKVAERFRLERDANRGDFDGVSEHNSLIRGFEKEFHFDLAQTKRGITAEIGERGENGFVRRTVQNRP